MLSFQTSKRCGRKKNDGSTRCSSSEGNFLHSHQVVALYLYNDAVQLRAVEHALQFPVGGVGLDLLQGLGPLFVSFSFGSVGLEVLQFKDVAVLDHRVDGVVGQQEEVAIAMAELHLRRYEVIGVEAEVGIHEALQVALALDELPYSRGVVVGFEDIVHHWPPLALHGGLVERHVQLRESRGAYLLEGLHEVVIVLYAHVVVRYAELQGCAEGTADGEHAVVEEQADEVVHITT